MYLIKFSSKNCPACNSMNKFLSKYNGLEVKEIYIEDDPELAESYGITALPTLISETGSKYVGFSSLSLPKWLEDEARKSNS